MNSTPRIRSVPEIVLLLLLALGPVTFSRWTQECFEVPRSALFATGALVLLGWAMAREMGRAAREGGAYPAAALGRLRDGIARDPLGISILLFLGSALLSTLTSPNPAQSLHGAADSSAGLIVACSTAVLYFAARASGGDARALLRMAKAVGFATAIAAGYALLQLTGLDPLVWGRTASYGGEVRIFGTLGHPNLLGGYLAMTVPLTVWLASRAGGGAGRALWATIATAAAVALAATLSRGAWIGLAAGAVTVPALWLLGGVKKKERAAPAPRPRAALLLFLLLGVAAALFLAMTPMGPHLLERVRQIASLSAPTTQSRLHIWRAAWRMFRDHPARGVGLDAFGTVFPGYRTPDYWNVEWGRTPTKAHNEALGILASQGLLGGLAALLILTLAGVAAVRAVRRPEGAARSGAIVAGAALVAFVVQDMAGFTVVALGSLAAALAGWLGAAGTPGRSVKQGPRRTPPWTMGLAAAAMVALFFPLVLRPLLAQHMEKIAFAADPDSPERASAFERAAREAPWDGRYPSLLGAALLAEAGREPGAARSLLSRAAEAERRAVSIEPENGYFHAALGRVAAARAQLHPPEADEREVRAAFTEALKRDPVNAEIMDQISNTMIQLGRTEEARAASLTAARLYPGFGQPLAFLGYTALLNQRWADAADTLSRAVRGRWYGEVPAQEAAWSNLSAAYLALNRNEEARRAAEEALALLPGDKDAQGNRDLAMQRLGARR